MGSGDPSEGQDGSICLAVAMTGWACLGVGGCWPGAVDLAFADPPFNIGYEYDVYDARREADHYLDWTRRWAAEVTRVLKPDGTFWLAIGDEYAAELKLIFHREQGLCFRSWVIWY